MYKVLIVEDENLIRRGLIYRIDWLSLDCAVPLEAQNGEVGLKIILDEKPDIVITDVQMPLMDGIEMLERGLQQYRFESIVISGYEEFSYAQTALRLGVSEYLLKPIVVEELKAIIVKLCAMIRKKTVYDEIDKMIELSEDLPLVLDLMMLSNTIKRTSRRVTTMLQYVQSNYQERISLKELASQIDVSATYLNQKFKEETGYTFNEFLNRFRIQKAVELLHDDQYRIYEVAEVTGFSDYRYFSIVFKKYVGCTPTEFSKGRSSI